MGRSSSAPGSRPDPSAWDGVERRSASRLRLPPELERRRDASQEPPRLEPDLSGLERHRGPGRRLSAYTKAAEEGEMTREQFLFLKAIDEFKRANDRPYPSWTDVLEVVRLLGYRKTMPSELRVRSAEDWLEKPDAPAGVRPPRWEDHARRAGQAPPPASDGENPPRAREAA